MNIRTIVVVGFLSLMVAFVGCNSTKKASASNIDELYNIWQIDSVEISGNIIPNSFLLGGILEFKENGIQTVTINEKVETINFEVKDKKLINLDKPEEEPLTISALSKDKLILEGDEGTDNKIRMVLTSIKK